MNGICPYRLSDYYNRTFYIGEHGTPIEAQLYHHFKAQQAQNVSLTCQFPYCSREIHTNKLKSLYLFIPKKGFLVNNYVRIFPTALNKRKVQNGQVIFLSSSDSPHKERDCNTVPVCFKQSNTLDAAMTFSPVISFN